MAVSLLITVLKTIVMSLAFHIISPVLELLNEMVWLKERIESWRS